MKRFITILFAAVAAFTLAAAVSAQEIEDHLSLLYNGDLVSVMFDVDREEKFSDQQAKLYSILENGMKARTEKIDVSEAGYDDIDAFKAFVTETLNVEAFWQKISGDVTYTVNDKSGMIEYINFEYYPAEEKKENVVFFSSPSDETEIKTVEQGIAHALQEVKDGMSVVEKALVLHDYIARECDYYPATLEQLEIIGNEDPNHPMFSAQGVFVDRIAVCQGYAIAYSQLLYECGITSCIVASDPMKHAWNMVKLGDDWYHVDVTWDDPSNMRGGFVYHDYFLKSDEEFKTLKHHDWYHEGRLDPSNINYADTPLANKSNSFQGYVFREIMINNGERVQLYQPRLIHYLDGKYYTLLYGESDTPGVFYSNATLFCETDFEGSGPDNTGRKIFRLNEYNLGTSYNYLMMYQGKLYASNRHSIVELDKTGNIVRYLINEREKTIDNFWFKLDKLSYKMSGVDYVLDINSVGSAQIDDVVYILYSDGTASVIGYVGTEMKDELKIQSHVNGHKVIEIGQRVFLDAETLNKVVLPSTIEKIDTLAFAITTDIETSLSEINFPTGLREIGAQAFLNSELTRIELPVTLKSLGKDAFSGAVNLDVVKFLGDVPETWGEDPFYYCGMRKNQYEEIFSIFKLKINPLRKSWTLTTEQNGAHTWTKDGVTYQVDTYEAPATGDFDGDDAITEKDVNAIADFFAGKTADAPAEEWADIDKKDGVTRKDAMLLARYKAGWNSVKSYFEE